MHGLLLETELVDKLMKVHLSLFLRQLLREDLSALQASAMLTSAVEADGHLHGDHLCRGWEGASLHLWMAVAHDYYFENLRETDEAFHGGCNDPLTVGRSAILVVSAHAVCHGPVEKMNPCP